MLVFCASLVCILSPYISDHTRSLCLHCYSHLSPCTMVGSLTVRAGLRPAPLGAPSGPSPWFSSLPVAPFSPVATAAWLHCGPCRLALGWPAGGEPGDGQDDGPTHPRPRPSRLPPSELATLNSRSGRGLGLGFLMAGQDELRPINQENPNHEDVEVDGTVGAEGVEAADAGAQEGDEEGRAPAQVHIPHQVSPGERDEHEITHTHPTAHGAASRPRARTTKPPQITR